MAHALHTLYRTSISTVLSDSVSKPALLLRNSAFSVCPPIRTRQRENSHETAIKYGWCIVKRMYSPLALLVVAVLIPGPMTTAAQESAPKPPNHKLAAVSASGAQRPATKKPVWTLDRLVNEAVSVNPETLSKRASLEAAEASVDAAFQQFFPSPYAKAQQGYEQDNDQTTDSSERVGIFGLQQPIWTGGKLTADLNVAKASALSVDSSIAETQLSLAQRVVAAYQNLMMYHERIKAQTVGIELLEKHATMMDRRVQSSISAPVDLVLINSRISQARSDLSTFKNGQQTALAQLGQLVGHPLKADDVEFDTSMALSPPQQPDEVIRQALQTNPTLRRMDADINTVVHQEEKQRAALMPTLSVKAEYQNGLFDKDSHDEEDTRIYTTLDFSPGAGLSSLANIRSATARISATKQAKKAAQRDLTSRIQTDYEDCQNAYARHRLIGKTVLSSREVLESYTRLFVAGKRSWIDVLNATRELTQNELIMADVLAVYQASAYRLRLHAGEVEWLQKNNRLREGEGPGSIEILTPEPVKIEQPGEEAKAIQQEPTSSEEIVSPASVKIEQPGEGVKAHRQESENSAKIVTPEPVKSEGPSMFQRVTTLFTFATPESAKLDQPDTPVKAEKQEPMKIGQPGTPVKTEKQEPVRAVKAEQPKPVKVDSLPATKACVGIGCTDANTTSKAGEGQNSVKAVTPEPVKIDQPVKAVKAEQREPARDENLPSMEDQCIGVGCGNAAIKSRKVESSRPVEFVTPEPVEAATTESTQDENLLAKKKQCIGVGCTDADSK